MVYVNGLSLPIILTQGTRADVQKGRGLTDQQAANVAFVVKSGDAIKCTSNGTVAAIAVNASGKFGPLSTPKTFSCK